MPLSKHFFSSIKTVGATILEGFWALGLELSPYMTLNLGFHDLMT